MIQTHTTTDIWTPSSETFPYTGGGAGILEPGEQELSDDRFWSDYPIAGHDDELDEDERYFLEEDDDDDGDDDSDIDSDYDDDFDDETDDEVDEDIDSDDENF